MIATTIHKIANSLAAFFGRSIENIRAKPDFEQAADYAGIATTFDANAKAHSATRHSAAVEVSSSKQMPVRSVAAATSVTTGCVNWAPLRRDKRPTSVGLLTKSYQNDRRN
jgi:hypothetical protein